MRCLILVLFLCLTGSAVCAANNDTYIWYRDVIEPGATITLEWRGDISSRNYDRVEYIVYLFDEHGGELERRFFISYAQGESRVLVQFKMPDDLSLYDEADYFYFSVTAYFRKDGENEPVNGYFRKGGLFRIEGVSNIAKVILPPKGVWNNSKNPLFRWSRTPNTTAYHLQVARWPDVGGNEGAFADSLLVFNDSTLTDTTYTVFGLQPGTEYSWRVRSKDASWKAWYQSWFSTTTTQLTDDRIITWLPGYGDSEDIEIRSIAINSLGYVFAASSWGLCRSIDNGENWELIAFKGRNISGVSISADDIVFIAYDNVADFGGGVYRSADDGLTWKYLPNASGTPIGEIKDIVCGPDNLLLAINDRTMIYWSYDRGETWKESGYWGNRDTALAIAIDSSSGQQTWWVAMPNGIGGIYNPATGQWKQSNLYRALDIEVSATGIKFAAADHGVIMHEPNSSELSRIAYPVYKDILTGPGGDLYTGDGRYNPTTGKWLQLWKSDPPCCLSAVALDRYGRVYAGNFNTIIRTLEPADSMIAGVSPRNNSVLSAQSAKLTWPKSHYPNARYHVQVSQTPDFPGKFNGGNSGALLQPTELVLDDESIIGAEKTVSGLVSGGTYFWRVATLVNGKRGSWSPVYRFDVSTSTSVLPGFDDNARCRLVPQEGAIRVEAQIESPSDISLVLYNYLGAEVSRFSRSAVYGAESMMWNIGDLAAGTYVCKISIGNRTWTQVLPVSY